VLYRLTDLVYSFGVCELFFFTPPVISGRGVVYRPPLANLPIPNHIAIWLVVSSLSLENEEDDCPQKLSRSY
ncbi:MAG: hypothetical protein K2I47_01560, partial [Odoribacter sp.]|nr:hypothetical protein [Odoribacter sp.]